MTSSRFLCTAVAALAITSAGCSSSTGGGPKGTGGGSGTGGTPGEGGTTGSGGVAGSGGAIGSGGQAAGGGASGTGGGIGAGGSSASGGAAGSGGKSGGGGVSSTGGASMGGASGTGGSAGGGSGGSGGSPGKNSDGGIADGGSRDGGSTARDAAGANTPEAGGGGSGGFDPCPATGDCKILPLGDSITAGAGTQPGDNGGYRVELFTKAVNDSKHITFVGSLSSGPNTVADGGVTFPKNHEGHIGWVITQINNIATTAQTVTVSGTSYAGALRDMPNIVLLFIGTNDEGYASSEAGASDRLGQLIDKIVAALPNALLVVSSIYPFPGCQSTNYTPTQCAGNVATYDAAIPGVIQPRVAQGKHVLFVDMSTPPTGALATDGVHPNDTVGYPWMGDKWYTVIKSYLH